MTSKPHCYMPTLFLFILLGIPTLVLASKTSSSDSAEQYTTTSLFEATYEGKISGFRVKIHRSLTQVSSEQYIFSSISNNFFASIRETSQFALNDNSVQTAQYTYKSSIAKSKKKETIDFNWSSMQAEYRHTKRPEQVTKLKLSENRLDPLSYQLFLQSDAFLNKKQFNYSFIKRKRIENYTFQRLANEKLTINQKEYLTWVLERSQAGKKNKKTKVWIIPELDHQIGKIEHTDKKGSTYQAVLSEYSSNKEALHKFYLNTAKLNASSTHIKLNHDTKHEHK